MRHTDSLKRSEFSDTARWGERPRSGPDVQMMGMSRTVGLAVGIFSRSV
jgi:hypothetical protein